MGGRKHLPYLNFRAIIKTIDSQESCAPLGGFQILFYVLLLSAKQRGQLSHKSADQPLVGDVFGGELQHFASRHANRISLCVQLGVERFLGGGSISLRGIHSHDMLTGVESASTFLRASEKRLKPAHIK